MSQVNLVPVSVKRLLQPSVFLGRLFLLTALCVQISSAQSAAPAGRQAVARPTLLAHPRASVPEVPATKGIAHAASGSARVTQSEAAGTPSLHPNTPTAGAAAVKFLSAPFVSDGAPDVYGEYGAYLALSGDFAHKNHLDTVVFQDDGTLNYMSNDGNGNFTKKYVTVNPTFVNINNGVAADLNGDGYLDIVAACSSPVGFLVFLNNGDGTFAAANFTTLPKQTGPGSRLVGTFLNIADVNKDGKQDIVASAYMYGQSGNSENGTLYNMFYAGNGDGTFQAPVVGSTAYTGTATGLRGVILADMNNDGKMDAVGAVWRLNATSGAYTVYLAVGQGDGAGHFAQFGNPTSTNTVSGSSYADATMQAIDLNNDGKMDILWTPSVQYAYTSLGNGDGTLQDPNTSITTVKNMGSFTTGDFNADGYTDVAVFMDGLVSIYIGQGNGSFSTNPITQYANELAGFQPLVAQDFNGDGKPDLLIASAFRNQLSLLKSYGDGTFLAAPLVIPQNSGSDTPNSTEDADYINVDATGNWFGDGKLNLLAEETSGSSDYLDYATQNGSGGFNFTRVLNLTQLGNVKAIEPVSADFNKDGRDDFILALTDGIGIGLSNGDGTITRVSTTFSVSLSCGLSYAAVGDVNNDGKQDIVVVYAGDSSCSGSGSQGSGYFVLLGDGTGNFKTSFTAFGDQLYQPRLADLNHDGNLDLILDDISSTTPALYVIPGDGTGTYLSANVKTIVSGVGTLNSFLLDDFNQDGIPDLTLLQAGISGATDNTEEGIVTMVGKGDFTFQSPQFLNRGITGVGAVYTDFYQDKLPYLVVNLGLGTITFGGVAIYPNLGSGNFGSPEMLQSPGVSTGEVNNILFAGDFNGDGAPDLLLGAGDGYVPNVFFPNAYGNQLTLVAESTTTTQYDALELSASTVAVGGQQPTGSVSFYSNGNSIGSASLVSGIASMSTTALPSGTDTITAKYFGDSLNYGSTSNSVVVTVTALAPSYELSESTSQLSLKSGTPGNVTLTLQANEAFKGNVTFKCQGLPALVYCSFQPATVSLDSNGSGTLTAVITYNSQLAGVSSPGRRTGIPAAGIALAGMLAFLFPVRRKYLLRLGIATVLFGSLLMTGLTGCSDSSSKTPVAANFNIVATGVSGSTSVVRSTSLSVSLQP